MSRANNDIVADLLEIKQAVDRSKAEHNRADGAYRQIMQQIRKEFGCKTLEEAEKLLTKLRREEAAALLKVERYIALFKSKWGNKLESEND